MHYDPFEVEVITEQAVSTQQKILTAVLAVYFLVSASSIGLVLFYSLFRP